MIERTNTHTAQAFTFAPEEIDRAAAFVGDGMERLGLARRDALRNRLMVEEVLLRWRTAKGLEDTYTIVLSHRLGRVNLVLRCAGFPQDPLVGAEDEDFGTGRVGWPCRRRDGRGW